MPVPVQMLVSPASWVANVLVDGIVDNADIGVSAFDSDRITRAATMTTARAVQIFWQTAADSSRGDVPQITHAASGIFTGLYFHPVLHGNLSAAASGNIVFE